MLASGGCAILDASFLRESQRQAAYRLAHENDARVLVIECNAPEAVLHERLAQRVEEGAVSDGRPEILDGQLHVFEPIQAANGVSHEVIQTNQERDAAMEELWAIL